LSQDIDILAIRIGTFDVVFMNEESDQQVGASQPDSKAEQGDEKIHLVSPPVADNQFDIQ
jgi:hypothetical protein